MFLNKSYIGKKYFVSIGAGINQIPLITKAKDLGFLVIGVDYNSMAPGFIHCDLKIQESIENYHEIYQKLSELLFVGEIAGIMTKSYGNAIKTTSFLTDLFGIPFLSFENSDNFINKKKMKSVFKDHNIKTPDMLSITEKSTITKLKSKLPLIAKPAIGHAKINIEFITKNNQLQALIKIAKKNNKIILEKFIEGDEIITAGIVKDGVYHLVNISDKIRADLPFFTDIMHISPSKYEHLSAALTEIGQTVSQAFDIITSPLIMEFIIDRNEEIFLIEAVPEFGGEFIPDVLVPAFTGYDIISETIKAITNTGFKPPAKRKIKNAVIIKYITGYKGKLFSCNPKGVNRTNGIIYSKIFKEIGSDVDVPKNNLERIGVIAAKGRTIDEAKEIALMAEDNLEIKIKIAENEK